MSTSQPETSPSDGSSPPECMLLGGTFGYVLQGVLFAFVVIGLLVKKCREKSSRTWFEFFLDSSKQMAGASWLHLLNIVFSLILQSLGGDECIWYFTNIAMDTTLGVFVNYTLHRLIYKVIVPKLCSPQMAANFKSGDYGLATGKVHWGKYFRQLFIWLFIVSVMKCVMVAIMALANVPLVIIAEFILYPFAYNPQLKLIVVMVFTPLVMNLVQFWITDSFTKKKAPAASDAKPRHHPEANPDSLEYEEVPLTHTDNNEEEEDMSSFPVSPFAVIFSNPDFDRQPRGIEAIEKEMKEQKKHPNAETVGAVNGPHTDSL